MGCCSSQEPLSSYPSLKTRTFSLTSQLAQTSESHLKSSFSSHVENLKTSDSFYSTILNSGINSSSTYKESLQGLNFFFSHKKFDSYPDVVSELSCPECLIDFNDNNETPLILTCSHSMCKKCCEQLFNMHGNILCYFNCIPTTEHPGSLKINHGILETTEAKEKGLFCYDHSEICSELCINCIKVVCINCVSSHEKHRFVKLNSESFNSEVHSWEKNLKIYEKQIQENIEKLKKHKNRFSALKLAIINNLAEFCTQLTNSTEIVRAGFIRSASDHEENLDYFVSSINESMPFKPVSLYDAMVKRELEKSNEVLANLQNLPLTLQLKELSKVPLKAKISFNLPNTQSWQELEKQIRLTSHYQELLLAITAVKLT